MINPSSINCPTCNTVIPQGQPDAPQHFSLNSAQARVIALAQPRLNASFVNHVTYDEENNKLAPNTPFVKTWKFINSGQLTWPAKMKLFFVSNLTGGQMSGPDYVSLNYPKPIQPGETVDISVNLVAPEQLGEHTGFWKLADEAGKKFGPRVRVKIEVVAENAANQV